MIKGKRRFKARNCSRGCRSRKHSESQPQILGAHCLPAVVGGGGINALEAGCLLAKAFGVLAAISGSRYSQFFADLKKGGKTYEQWPAIEKSLIARSEKKIAIRDIPSSTVRPTLEERAPIAVGNERC